MKQLIVHWVGNVLTLVKVREYLQLGLCISQPPALCLAPALTLPTRSEPQFVFTGSGPQFLFTGIGPQFVFTGPGPQFVFTGPDQQFCYQSGAWFCIYRPCLLNLYFYLRPWRTICIIGLVPEFAFTLLLVIVAVVVVIVVVVFLWSRQYQC